MTNFKLRNPVSACTLCFSQVLLKLFTFLVNTTNIEIYTRINSYFYSPLTIIQSGHLHYFQLSYGIVKFVAQVAVIHIATWVTSKRYFNDFATRNWNIFMV